MGVVTDTKKHPREPVFSEAESVVEQLNTERKLDMHFFLGLTGMDGIERSVQIDIVEGDLILDIKHFEFILDAVLSNSVPFWSEVTLYDQEYETECYRDENFVVLDLGESTILAVKQPVQGWLYECPGCGRRGAKLYKTSADAPFGCDHCIDEVPKHVYGWWEDRVFMT
jgi:hypothetical protein